MIKATYIEDLKVYEVKLSSGDYIINGKPTSIDYRDNKIQTERIDDIRQVTKETIISHYEDAEGITMTEEKYQKINDVFTELNKQDISISSMRNKTNRLEQLFLARLRDN